jgi:hypothetical protein
MQDRVKLADRQRRFRHRRRNGLVVAPVEVDGSILDLLIDARWLSETDAASSRLIGEAISRNLRLLALEGRRMI